MRRLAALAVAVLALSACSQDENSIAGQAAKGDDKGYISQSGVISHLPVDQRKEPLTLAGTTLDGEKWSIGDAKGKVVVLNVWGSWCPPCTKEQPELQAAWTKVKAQKLPVQFIGIDIREDAATAKAFVRANGVTYPSLANDGTAVASLQNTVSSPPVTLVVDRAGRIAGRITGATTTATLVDLVEDVVKDGA